MWKTIPHRSTDLLIITVSLILDTEVWHCCELFKGLTFYLVVHTPKFKGTICKIDNFWSNWCTAVHEEKHGSSPSAIHPSPLTLFSNMDSREIWRFPNSGEFILDRSNQNRPISDPYLTGPIVYQHCTLGRELSCDDGIKCQAKRNKQGRTSWHSHRSGSWIDCRGTGYYFFVTKWVKVSTLWNVKKYGSTGWCSRTSQWQAGATMRVLKST